MDGPAESGVHLVPSSCEGSGHSKTLNFEVQTLSGDVFMMALLPSATVPTLYRDVEEASGVPVRKQRLVHNGTILQLSDERTLHDCGVSDGERLTLVVGSTPYSWNFVGHGSTVSEGSMGPLFEKTCRAPDYTGAIGLPGITGGEHSWTLWLRGSSRCEIGVCDETLTVADLNRELRDRTWQAHFSGGSDTLGCLYINNAKKKWTGVDGRAV